MFEVFLLHVRAHLSKVVTFCVHKIKFIGTLKVHMNVAPTRPYPDRSKLLRPVKQAGRPFLEVQASTSLHDNVTQGYRRDTTRSANCRVFNLDLQDSFN